MIKFEVICDGKSSKIDNGVRHEIVFRPLEQTSVTHATGAVIGTPNAFNQILTNDTEPAYNVLTGSFIISTKNESEADNYKLGEVYVLSINIKPKSKE